MITVTEAAKEAISDLYKKYLLAQTAGDIMLGEVSEHLYVSDLDFKQKNHVTLKKSIVEVGFYETVETGVINLFNYKKDMKPYSLLTDYMNADEMVEKLLSYIEKHTTIYNAKEILENPYYKTVRITEDTRNGITLKENNYLPGEFFQTYRSTYDDKDPFAYADIGLFDDEVHFPMILEEGNVWMSVVMSEILSMQEPIQKAKGNVITYGLGLGYYTFMVSEKKDVESITVIEMNPDVIALFKKNLLPQFPHKEKVKIIQADAYEYVKTQKDGQYDYAFSDFWGGMVDGVQLYLPFARASAKFKKTKSDYWIETCFLEYFFRPALLKVLMSLVSDKKILLTEEEPQIQKIQKKFIAYCAKQNYEIKNEKDLYQLLSTENLINWMRDFAKQM